MVNARDKYLALKRIVDFYPRIYAIIFCRTKIETQEVADKLIKDGYNAEALHGDLSQQQRDLTMQKFRNHLTQLLVATDVAARGLDVDDLTHVINYGLPDDVENYTHRSGRTGRAGKKGTSISIIHSREKFKVRNIEKIIGKEFVDGTLPTPEEICKKQLFKTMDDIMKADVDEELIAPYMPEINRQFDYVDKEDIIKKMVSITFGKFLDYYKNAPEIVKPTTRGRDKSEQGDRNGRGGKGTRDRKRGPRQAEAGYRRLFINLGKQDGFYPGEVMQFINKHIHGHQEVGHIDLLQKFSYIEVPEGDAQRVMRALDGTAYKGREVRCNDADESGHGRSARGSRTGADKGDRSYGKSGRGKGRQSGRAHDDDSRRGRDDWKQLMADSRNIKLRGEVPDFSEEGWARRRPKKK
jgi:ATP-dependent RNA helicase DeaD